MLMNCLIEIYTFSFFGGGKKIVKMRVHLWKWFVTTRLYGLSYKSEPELIITMIFR